MPSYREVFLFTLETPTPAYLWSGVGNLVAPDGRTYTGMGELLNFPEVHQLINGVAERVDFTVSGVDGETIALAGNEAPEVDGAKVRIGSLTMGEDNQPLGPIDWEWEGVADVVSVDRSSDGAGNGIRSVSLSVGSADTARSRSDLTFFTDADQRRRSPDDRFFDRVAGISVGITRRFGGKS